MSTVIIGVFNNPYDAGHVLDALMGRGMASSACFLDGCAAVRDREGSLSLTQTRDTFGNNAINGAGVGGILGGICGMLLFNPLTGFIAGSALGGTVGALANAAVYDYGIDDDIIKKLGSCLTPETSALFLMFKDKIPKPAIEELGKANAHILKMEFGERQEDALRKKIAEFSGPGNSVPVRSFEFQQNLAREDGTKTVLAQERPVGRA